MNGTARLAFALTLTLLLAGCAGTSKLLHRHAPPPPPSSAQGRAYLSQLTAEQTQLQSAERQLPARPRTPGQLSHAIALLGGAMSSLAGGLAAIDPPDDVAELHQRLVTISRAYARRLQALAVEARSPKSEVAAANALATATAAASGRFTATSAQIRKELAR